MDVVNNLLGWIKDQFMQLSTIELLLIALILLLSFYLLRPQPAPSTKPQPFVPKPKPVPRDFTLEELRQFNGNKDGTPIYLGVKGKIYDVR
jgi:hypothetical protein